MSIESDENGNPTTTFNSIDLHARRCKKSDFEIDKDYFHNLDFLNDLYCIDD